VHSGVLDSHPSRIALLAIGVGNPASSGSTIAVRQWATAPFHRSYSGLAADGSARLGEPATSYEGVAQASVEVGGHGRPNLDQLVGGFGVVLAAGTFSCLAVLA
jgi:hypothetical protein